MIRVPAHTAEQMRKVEQAKSQLLQRGGEEPTTAQIAEISGLSEDKVIRLQNLMPEVCSLDIPVGEGSEDALQQLLQDVQAPQPQEELVRRELEQLLGRLLDMLEPRQSRILRLHFGMEDGTCHSLEEIAGMLNISKERARQIEKQAMEKLQKMGANLGLEDFLE
jgi:RNA polymerase primary sigma factor